MTRTGLADGRRDLKCYADRVTEAGEKCVEITAEGEPALEEYLEFCVTFDALGMLVRLDQEPYLFRQPALEEHVPHTIATPPGGPNALTITTCEAGLVTYQCEQ